jgi:hypothetical protein
MIRKSRIFVGILLSLCIVKIGIAMTFAQSLPTLRKCGQCEIVARICNYFAISECRIATVPESVAKTVVSEKIGVMGMAVTRNNGASWS